MRIQRSIWVLVVAALGLAGCGGDENTTEELETTSRTSGGERPRERQDGAGFSGLMGTIRRDQVENTLTPRMERFQRCFLSRMGAVEYLAGDIHLGFRVHTDGSVAWVYPQRSTIGDREVEQCILDVARRARFPRPRGGEAEFEWGFGLDAADDIRPPLNWGEDALGSHADELSSIARECNARGGHFHVTAYIEPGGSVLAVGGTMPSAEHAQALDCVLSRVGSWTMRDPGSYAAKISFTVR